MKFLNELELIDFAEEFYESELFFEGRDPISTIIETIRRETLDFRESADIPFSVDVLGEQTKVIGHTPLERFLLNIYLTTGHIEAVSCDNRAFAGYLLARMLGCPEEQKDYWKVYLDRHSVASAEFVIQPGTPPLFIIRIEVYQGMGGSI